jgi:hypothetical protein
MALILGELCFKANTIFSMWAVELLGNALYEKCASAAMIAEL